MFTWINTSQNWRFPHISLAANDEIYLRPFVYEDTLAYQQEINLTLSEPETPKYMLTFPQPFYRRHARARISQTHQWLREDRGWSLALIYKGNLAGQMQIICGLPSRRRAEVSYWLSPTYRRIGLARKGVSALIKAAQKQWPVDQIEATVVPGNSESIALLKDLGFTQQEIAPVSYRVQGQWRRKWADLEIFRLEG